MGLALAFASIHGLLYIIIVPPWQHYDEPSHFEYAWLIANRSPIPKPGDFDLEMRRQVAASMRVHGFFADLGLLPSQSSAEGPEWIGGYSQLGEPPLYYLVAAVPLKLFSRASIDQQLHSARLVSLGFYLLSVGIAFGVVKELTPSGHALRWIVPLSMAMLPAYTDLMTSVNNDTGAVAVFSFFLWGCVRMILRGPSVANLLWVTGAACVCWWTKSTILIALPLALLALVLALLRVSNPSWAWGVLAAGGLGVLLALFSLSDVACWYRATSQPAPTRARNELSPLGEYAILLSYPAERNPPWLAPLSQPLPLPIGRSLAGKTVTLGAWMWADRPVQARTPSLHTPQGSFHKDVALGYQPSFQALTATLDEDNQRVWITLDPIRGSVESEVTVFFDGLVLAEGVRPVDQAPQFLDASGDHGEWGGQPFENLLRNSSAERIGLSLRPWVDNFAASILPDQTRLSTIIYSLTDPSGAGWYYKITAASLIRSFWATFGWGQVPLLGHKPYRTLAILTLLGLLVSGWVLWRRRGALRWEIVFWLGVLLLGIWGAAIVRGSTYLFVKRVFIPVARYAYPAIIPTMLLLCLGWLEILRQVGARLGLSPRFQYIACTVFFISLDSYALVSLYQYYLTR